jgi:DNA topoisomerase IA
VKATDEADNSFTAKLVAIGQGKPDPRNREQALAIVEELQGASYSVLEIQRKEKRKSPAPPFTTSTLQQETSKKLRFSLKETMKIAQELYERKASQSNQLQYITIKGPKRTVVRFEAAGRLDRAFVPSSVRGAR